MATHCDQLFCSQKAEVLKDEATKTSEALYQFCKNEVLKSVNEYLKESTPKEKMSKYELKEKAPFEARDEFDDYINK